MYEPHPCGHDVLADTSVTGLIVMIKSYSSLSLCPRRRVVCCALSLKRHEGGSQAVTREQPSSAKESEGRRRVHSK